MTVDLAPEITKNATQNGNFYVPGSFANGGMFGNNQPSVALAGNAHLGPQPSTNPQYGVNAYSGNMQYPSGYPSTGYPSAYPLGPGYHQAPHPYSQFTQYQPNTTPSTGNAERGDFGMGDASFADFNIGNYQGQYGYGNGAGRGPSGNPGYGRRQ
jgi:hypothetical protein